MSLGTAKCPDLVIPIGTDVSNILTWRHIEDAYLLMLYGPAAVDVGHTYIIQVTYDPEPKVSSTWYTFQTGNPLADAALPLVGKAAPFPEPMACMGFRIKDSTGVVGANRTWRVTKHFYAWING